VKKNQKYLFYRHSCFILSEQAFLIECSSSDHFPDHKHLSVRINEAGAEEEAIDASAVSYFAGAGLRSFYGKLEYENRKGLILCWDVMNLFSVEQKI